ncbi:FtsX-like permease family protein [Ornithinibacillus contaminans]|uniref:FtsX-like permease family protein n=1 Tax=Ornithinibacillus contaminans TaxID=694055 RepID=UPI00064DAEB5|nr:FtsX-like permease family protein [Ornithinibacillus contaminans]
MKQLLKKNLIKNIKTSILLFFAFCLIFSIIPIALFSITTMHSDIHADIAENSRGSYDLLVRSPVAISTIEKKLNIVPENYLGGGKGGISLAQWQKIKGRDDIEIAAPVASLGYFTGLNTTLGVLPSPDKASSYQVEYSTTDGVNDYVYNTYEQLYLETNNDDYPLEVLVNQKEMFSFMHPLHALFPLPVTYNHLVAVDAKEEEKLTGISFTAIKYGEEQKGLAQGPGSDPQLLESVHIIPVMQLQDSDISIKAKIKHGELPFTKEDTLQFQDQLGVNEIYEIINDIDDPEYQQFFDELMDAPKTNEIYHELELTDYVKPFNAEAKGLVVSENGEILDMDEYSKSVSYANSINWNNITRYYLADPVSYKQTDDGLRVDKVGQENGIPTYRQLEEKGISIKDTFGSYESLQVMTDPVGYYQIDGKDTSLASSPLGIYQLEPVKYIDANRKEITLTPTFTAGSFVTAPAEGITNIESAEFVKGDKPIDAIRVKVAGIDAYSPEAAKKIENISNEIKQMGLHVDVVAGSSLQTINVDIEGVGVVQESWTTLGASGQIVGQWDITNLLLAIAFVLASIIYVLNRIKLWSTEKAEGIRQFKLLGWKFKHIKSLYQKEIFCLLTLSVILSLIGVGVFMHTEPQYSRLLLFQVSVIIAIFIFVKLLVRKHLNFILEEKITETPQKVKTTNSLILRNVFYYRKSIFSTFLQILLVSSLASFVYLSLTKSVAQTNLTILGQYINAGVGGWNNIVIFCTLLLTLITLIENLSTMLHNRRGEITNFKLLGWKYNDITNLYLKEISLWTGIALLIGCAISFAFFFSFYPVSLQNLSFIILTGLCLYIFIIFISYGILKGKLRKSLH